MSPITKPNYEPFRLLSVNKAPERAFRLVGRVATDLEDSGAFLLEHIGNCATIEEVDIKVRDFRPDILMTASMWTPGESAKVFEVGKSIMGERLLTHAIPPGMQVKKGPDFVVEYLKQELPQLVRVAIEEGTVLGAL